MADLADQHDQTSPTELDDAHSVGNGTGEPRGIKRARPNPADDDDDDDEKGGRERRKIEIKFISDKSRRHITFSKRKAGIMKKVRPARFVPIRRACHCSSACPHSRRRDLARVGPACSARFKSLTQILLHQAYELSVLTGTQVLLLVVSETGLVYTFTTPKLQPLVTKAEGKNLIQVRETRVTPSPISAL